MKKISFRNDILPLKNELYRLALRITLNPAEAGYRSGDDDQGLEPSRPVGRHRLDRSILPDHLPESVARQDEKDGKPEPES